ncbi:unnamed protein product [Colias eurytheme]|nr:unnamed protein product [Colias eurytheme]
MLSSIRLLNRTCACLRFQKRSIEQKPNSESPLRRLLRDASAFGEADPTKAPEGELLWATQPYATGVQESLPHQVDPAETTVLLFPGQGSQRVGMGKCLDNVPSAKELYELASSVVG